MDGYDFLGILAQPLIDFHDAAQFRRFYFGQHFTPAGLTLPSQLKEALRAETVIILKAISTNAQHLGYYLNRVFLANLFRNAGVAIGNNTNLAHGKCSNS